MMELLKNKYDIGVIIGRFQVPQLTDAHKELINLVRNNHKKVLILIGTTETLGTKSNPLGYDSRMKMIQKDFPNCILSYVQDNKSDEVWSKDVDSIIRTIYPLGTICLYGSRKSFIPCYSGKLDTFELGVISDSEGSKIRNEAGKVICDSADFRKGVIYSSQNQYPKVFLTVDIAVIKKEGREIRVLMGRRKGLEKFRFPGGFVSPIDENLEVSARRELTEEIDVEADDFEYISSNLQQDWRYKDKDEKIMTVFFKAQYIFGSIKPKEEFEETQWILLSPWAVQKIEDSHITLFETLISTTKGCKK